MADTASAPDPTDTPQAQPNADPAKAVPCEPPHLAAHRAMQEAEETVANAQNSEGLA